MWALCHSVWLQYLLQVNQLSPLVRVVSRGVREIKLRSSESVSPPSGGRSSAEKTEAGSGGGAGAYSSSSSSSLPTDLQKPQSLCHGFNFSLISSSSPLPSRHDTHWGGGAAVLSFKFPLTSLSTLQFTLLTDQISFRKFPLSFWHSKCRNGRLEILLFIYSSSPLIIKISDSS